MPDHAPEAEAREFAAAFSAFLNWIHESDRESGDRNPVAALVAGFLGPDGARLTRWSAATCPCSSTSTCRRRLTRGRRARAAPWTCTASCCRSTTALELQQIVSAESLPPIRLTAPALVDLPNGPELHARLPQARAAAGIRRPRPVRPARAERRTSTTRAWRSRSPGCRSSEAQAVLGELDQLRAELNVYRGHLLDVTLSPDGRHRARLRRPARPCAARTWCSRTPCSAGWSGTRSASPPTGRPCSPRASTSSAACCSTARPAPARRTPPATCSAR